MQNILRVLVTAVCLAVPGASAAGQRPSPTPYLYILDISGTPVGGFPSGVQVLRGAMSVVSKNGQPMLLASAPSEFLITLPQALPQDFTLEFDLIPKECCNPEDLAVEGTTVLNRGPASAHVVWHRETLIAVGGGPYFQEAMPPDLQLITPGNMTHIVMAFQGPTLTLYTNGRALYTQARQFARGRYLRVFLGGQDAGLYSVHLASLRVGLGAGNPGGVIASLPPPPPAPGAGPIPFPAPPPPPPTVVVPVPSLPPAPPPPAATPVGPPPGGPGQPVPTVVPPPAPAPAAIGPNPLPVVTPPPTSQSQSAGGGPIRKPPPTRAPTPPSVPAPISAGGTVPAGFTVTVTMGASGPAVSWPAVPGATGYVVNRFKMDDMNCCNTSSGRSWTALSPWQDSPLPMGGSYLYSVIAATPLGQMRADAQFDYTPPGAAPAPSAPPPITAVPAVPPTGTITPMAPPPQPQSQPPSVPPGGTVLNPARPGGTPVALGGSPPPDGLGFGGTPVTVQVSWMPPTSGTGNGANLTGYEVSRAPRGGGSWTLLTPTPLPVLPQGLPGMAAGTFDDILPSPTVVYTYQVKALYSDGTSGSVAGDYIAPPPSDPTDFVAAVTGPNEVTLSWATMSAPSQAFIVGPGMGNGATVPVVHKSYPGTAHRFAHVITGLPAGTHTWSIASSYTPGGVLTAQTAWPTATVTLGANSGRYHISVESVLANSLTEDDLVGADGRGNEFYVSAWVRTYDRAANKWLPEAFLRSATHGDIAAWPPPARIKAGLAGPTGGVTYQDLITPIWDQPNAASTGLSRFVLWTGTLTDNVEEVTIAPAIWESDDDAKVYNVNNSLLQKYPQILHMLDLNTRTLTGEISNVMLDESCKGTQGACTTRVELYGPEDRPVGVARPWGWVPSATSARWFPLGLLVTRAVAEAALSGAYGPPGLIPIRFIDHEQASGRMATLPYYGFGDFTLNIRITRLP